MKFDMFALVRFALVLFVGQAVARVDVERDVVQMFHKLQSTYQSSSLPGTLKFDDHFYPPKWKEVQSLHRFPKNHKTGAYIVDAWDYMHRMTLYRTLLESTNSHCLWKSKANNLDEENDLSFLSWGNILWGLPLQHGWQYGSGRLFITSTTTESQGLNTTTEKMNEKSWWPDMNYYLSVVPYLGAMEAGVVPLIEITYNPDTIRFCDDSKKSLQSCSEILTPWKDYFLKLQETATSCDKEYNTVNALPDTPIADRLNYHLSPLMESSLQLLWKAHISSINYALGLFPIENDDLLSSKEKLFGNSWSNLVDFIAEAYFPCNFTVTNLLQTVLPHRLLSDNDSHIPGQAEGILSTHQQHSHCNGKLLQVAVATLEEDLSNKVELNNNKDNDDLSYLEKRAIRYIDLLGVLNEASDDKIEEYWSNRMMCTEEGRSHGRKLLMFGIYRPIIIVEETIALLQLVQEEKENNTVCGIYQYK